MKKILLSMLTVVLCVITANAQNDTMYVMKAGVVVGKYNVNTQVDSVIFYQPSTDTSTTLTDADGNVYQTVTIGTQVWLAENLKTTKYNDGTGIPPVTGNSEWAALSTPAYCWYNNDEATYKSDYGALYNWYTVNNGNLCPTDWHVPSDEEWKQLEMYLGMSQSEADDTGWRGTDEGGKLKETGTTHWNSPNTGATNESGFTALPGGYRYGSSGDFNYFGNGGTWWSVTEGSTSGAWGRDLGYDASSVGRYSTNKHYGFSVRCLRD